MDFEYLFEEDFDYLQKFIYLKVEPKAVKAVAVPSVQTAFIILSNKHWKSLELFGGESAIIDSLCKTLVHETLHLVIKSDWKQIQDYDYDGEERVCMIMADQTRMGVEYTKEELELCKTCNVSRMNHDLITTHEFVPSSRYLPK